MRKVWGYVQKHGRKPVKAAKKVWKSERLLSLVVFVLLGGLVLSFTLYNYIGEAVQIDRVAAARLSLEEIAGSINDVTNIRMSEIGQKDTIPKTVYEDLVLIQSDPPVMAPLPDAWATKLMTRGSTQLEDIDVSATYQKYDKIDDEYLKVTGEYLQLVVTLQSTIESNFLSDFANLTPLLPAFDTKVAENTEAVQDTLDRIKSLKIEDTDVLDQLNHELQAILDAYETFKENKDINSANEVITRAQRNIINILADYWDQQKQDFLEEMTQLNADLAIIESALK